MSRRSAIKNWLCEGDTMHHGQSTRSADCKCKITSDCLCTILYLRARASSAYHRVQPPPSTSKWPDIDKNFHSKLSILLRKCCFVEPSSNVKQKMTPLWQLVDLLRLVSLPISDGRASSCIDSPSPSWSWQLSKWQVGGEMHLICDSRARAG